MPQDPSQSHMFMSSISALTLTWAPNANDMRRPSHIHRRINSHISYRSTYFPKLTHRDHRVPFQYYRHAPSHKSWLQRSQLLPGTQISHQRKEESNHFTQSLHMPRMMEWVWNPHNGPETYAHAITYGHVLTLNI